MNFWGHDLGFYIVRGFDKTRQHITVIGRFDRLHEAKEFSNKNKYSHVYRRGISRPSWLGNCYDYIHREYLYELVE